MRFGVSSRNDRVRVGGAPISCMSHCRLPFVAAATTPMDCSGITPGNGAPRLTLSTILYALTRSEFMLELHTGRKAASKDVLLSRQAVSACKRRGKATHCRGMASSRHG